MPTPLLNYLDWELTPEQALIQSVVREFVEREAPPLVPRCFAEGRLAQLAVIWARPREDDGEVVRGFLVDAAVPGFTAHEVHEKLAMRASITSELVLQDCRVPAEAVLPGVRGMRGPLATLNEA